MTGRSGARPMPPATMTTSLPCSASSGQPLPNGPRSPTTLPLPKRSAARVTEPTMRIVCSKVSVRSGWELMEMAASPTPGT